MFQLLKNIFRYKQPNSIIYQLVDISKDDNGDHIVTLKIVDSPRGFFTLKAKQLMNSHRYILSKLTIEDTLTLLELVSNDNQLIIERKNSITYKYFAILSMLFISALLTANIASSKLITIFNYTMSGGVVVFPICYIVGDIITEVYGYKRSRQLIWGSVACFVFCVSMLNLVVLLPASEFWHNQNAYSLILGAIPRIIIASLISYIIGEFTNSYILAKMKVSAVKASKNNLLYLLKRIFLSCVIGIIFDTSIFIIIAYVGEMPHNSIFFLIIRQFIFKTSIEIILLPLTLYLIRYIKAKEGIDIVDIDTNFNPFLLDISYNSDNNLENKEMSGSGL
ncbi:MAG: queuosine precursor transporter [Neisseriaceae bacterium]|jgi:uncharacterized integral membrane protein (TIGR00697 family)